MKDRSFPARRRLRRLPSTLTLPVVVLVGALSSLPARADVCLPPPEDMKAWWTLDEESGTVSGERVRGRDGRHVNGPTPVQGLVGGALSFDGIDDYVVVPDSEEWDLGLEEFSMEFWGSFDRPAHGSQGHPGDVFISHDEGPGSLPKHFFSLSSSHLQFHVNGPGIGPVFSPLAPFAPEVGRWYHLAVTRSGSDYRIYVDGRLEAAGANVVEIPEIDALLTFGRALEPFGGFLDGRLDEVTLYGRALEEAEIRAIFEAGSAGKCKGVTIRTRALSALQLSVPASQELEAVGGTPPYEWRVAAGALPPGMDLNTVGIFRGTPTQLGSFSFVVEVADSGGEIDGTAFTVEVLLTPPTPDVRIHKAGITTVPGRTIEYFILVENRGLAAVEDLAVMEVLDASQFSLLAASPPPLADLELLAPLASVVWRVPSLAPGESQILVYTAALAPSVPLGTEVVGGPACQGLTARQAFVECLPEAAAAGLDCAECLPLCRNMSLFCRGSLPVCAGALATCLACLVEADLTGPSGCIPAANAFRECFLGRAEDLRVACTEDRQLSVAPLDPNEKLVLAPKFIRPDQVLVYPIHFENIGEVEALDVFITDVLDRALDLATLEVITHGGALDPLTRTLRWELRGRNLHPGETGNVLFLVRPLPGLPSGTEIRNRAEIQFEVFAPLITPEVVNIVDSTPPECTVEPLPEAVFDDRFEVRWEGRDEVGEIETFSIFVTHDGGESFELFRQTAETQAVFQGDIGGSYGFLCVAKDTVGNTEAQALVAEATTRVARAVIDVLPDSEVNRINLGSRGVIPVALLGSAALDVTRVARQSLGFGPEMARLAHRNGPHFEDVNGDAHVDLVGHFRTADTGIAPGDAKVCLVGEIGGAWFEACDGITTVPGS